MAETVKNTKEQMEDQESIHTSHEEKSTHMVMTLGGALDEHPIRASEKE